MTGPYTSSFGAIHFEGQPGFLFTVSGDAKNAVDVADALNFKAAHSQTFEEAFAATGYQYGEDALEQVRLGWLLARGEHGR